MNIFNVNNYDIIIMDIIIIMNEYFEYFEYW